MIANWPTKKKLAAILLLGGLPLAGFLGFVEIEGRLYGRFRDAVQLRLLHRSWVLDGSPYPIPDPLKYGRSNLGTSYVYTASHTIGGQAFQGLFAFREHTQPTVYVITTNGECLVLQDGGNARLMWIKKSGGAAW